MLDIQSTTRGLLIPAMTQTQRDAISSPATGLLIFQTDGTAGFYFFYGRGWTLLGSTGGAITGSGTDGYLTYWNGTNSVTGNPCLQWSPTDSILRIIGRVYQTGLGYSTFFGEYAGRIDNCANNHNSGFGYATLSYNTTGSSNTAIGVSSLFNNSTGIGNTAIGLNSLSNNTTGNYNTAIGVTAGMHVYPWKMNGTSMNSVFLGAGTQAGGYHDTNEIVIGYDAVGIGSNSVVLGNSSIKETILRGSVGLGTVYPNSSSIFDMTSTSKGLLIPRMTQAQRDVITSPATGLLIFQTDNTPGFYFYNGSMWTSVSSGGTVTGSGTSNYLTFWDGTNSVTGSSGLQWQGDSLLVINGHVHQTGLGKSTFFGYESGKNDDHTNNYNSGFGYQSLYDNTTGYRNSAFGYYALWKNITGYDNSAFGHHSLYNNTTGYENSAFGNSSLYNNTTGHYNSAFGYLAGTYITGYLQNRTSINSVYLGAKTIAFADGDTNEIVIGCDATGVGSNSVMLGNSNITKTILRGSIGLGTESPDSSSIFEMTSTSKGLLIPRMTQAQRNAIISPAAGLLIYQTDNTPGFYFYNGSIWTSVSSGGTVTGSGTNGYLTFWNGTNSVTGNTCLQWSPTDSILRITGRVYQTGLGYSTFFGENAGRIDNRANNYNSGFGYQSLYSNTIGDDNSAFGSFALYSNTEGDYNSAFGRYALSSITTSDANSAFGYNAGTYTNSNEHNRTCSQSVYIGYDTRPSANGNWNEIVIGFMARGQGTNSVVLGNSNITKTILRGNIGIGTESPNAPLQVNGRVYQDALNFSTFFGYQAGQNQDGTGDRNVAVGYNSMQNLTSGDHNTALGTDAGKNVTTGTYSVFLGSNSQPGANNNTNEIVIGYNTTGLGSNTVVLGNSSITNTYLRGTVAIDNTNPSVNLDVNGNGRFRSVGSGTYSTALNLTSDGTLTTSTSDIRMKTNIENLNKALEKISKLRGVSFNWKNEPEGQKHLGFIAQEVEEVIPELVFTNPVDGYKGINYPEITAVLTEAMKEQQTQINKLKSENEDLKNRLDAIEQRLDGKNQVTEKGGFGNNMILWVFLLTGVFGIAVFGMKKQIANRKLNAETQRRKDN